MIGSNAFNFINVLDKSADAAMIRQEVIANNLANVSTPDYKRKDVKFESYLQKQLDGEGSLDGKVRELDLSDLNSSIYTDCKELSYRFDGNNVDVDVENGYSAENQIRYNSLLESMSQEFSRMRMVLQK